MHPDGSRTKPSPLTAHDFPVPTTPSEGTKLFSLQQKRTQSVNDVLSELCQVSKFGTSRLHSRMKPSGTRFAKDSSQIRLEMLFAGNRMGDKKIEAIFPKQCG